MVSINAMYKSIKQSFVYSHLNDQTVLFLTVQFSINQQGLMVLSIAMYH